MPINEPAAVNRRTLSTTGIRLPELALGTWRYRGGIEPLRASIALGASFLDTAESYETEEIVGQAIQGNRKHVFLATKISPRHFRHVDVIKAAEASLQRLNTDYTSHHTLEGGPMSEPQKRRRLMVDEKLRILEEAQQPGVQNAGNPEVCG